MAWSAVVVLCHLMTIIGILTSILAAENNTLSDTQAFLVSETTIRIPEVKRTVTNFEEKTSSNTPPATQNPAVFTTTDPVPLVTARDGNYSEETTSTIPSGTQMPIVSATTAPVPVVTTTVNNFREKTIPIGTQKPVVLKNTQISVVTTKDNEFGEEANGTTPAGTPKPLVLVKTTAVPDVTSKDNDFWAEANSTTPAGSPKSLVLENSSAVPDVTLTMNSVTTSPISTETTLNNIREKTTPTIPTGTEKPLAQANITQIPEVTTRDNNVGVDANSTTPAGTPKPLVLVNTAAVPDVTSTDNGSRVEANGTTPARTPKPLVSVNTTAVPDVTSTDDFWVEANGTTPVGTPKPLVTTRRNSATTSPVPVEPTTKNNFREKCYDGLGCFNNSFPFNNDGLTLPLDPTKVGIEFRLFTRRQEAFEPLLYSGQDDITKSHFNSSLRTRVIIHGFMNSIDEQWMADIKDALLLVEDSNVILVGWGPGANGGYDQAVANLRLVADELSLLLIRLVTEAGLRLKDVHLIGHSLGAHTSGDTGRRLGGQIGRITGMDPAGPDFLNYNIAVLLDKTDAMFVDNIHTNGKTLLEGGAGISTPTAHVDFYVNGGRTQPGCKDGIAGLFSGGMSGVSCSHGRSHQLFLESIQSQCPFTAYPCANQSEFSLGRCLDCEPSGCSELGFHADQHAARGSLFINTRAKSPFCGFHYAVTIHAGQGADTKGTIYITVVGNWGSSGNLMVTEKEERLASGEDYVGVVVSPTAVGDIQSITVRYDKQKPFWGVFGGGNDVFAVDAVDVLSGESGRKYTFCLPTQRLTHSESVTLSESSDRGC